jgi:hypothetical protein
MKHGLMVQMSVTLASLTIMAAVGTVSAQATATAPGYERFAGCPSPEESSEELFCTRVIVHGGHFRMGSKDVPLTNPIVLSGGANFNTGKLIANSKGGLTPVRQTVPGGIIGLTGLDWLVNFLSLEDLKLYAVTELVGQPSLESFGEVVNLPIRVHLENPVLGKSCYVGSFTNPIKLHLTVGTTNPPPPNTPISGSNPESISESNGVVIFENGTFVDNAFAAPGATGCVLTLFGFLPISLNSLVNLQSGLPAPAGTNETKQIFNLEAVAQSTVYP